MSDLYDLSTGGGEDVYDWRTGRKKKRRRADEPYNPDTGFAGPQPTIAPDYRPTNPLDARINVSAGLGGGGGGIDPSNPVTTLGGGGGGGDGGGKFSTDPSVYDAERNNITLTAFPNSFASGVPGMGANPYSIPAFAQSPVLIANKMLADKYGLPAGSNVANAMSTYFNPKEKSLGMGGARPVSNVDWINLGASLMSGLKGNGQQLDPTTMMRNAVQTLMSVVQEMAAGGKGAPDKYPGPLGALAMQEPSEALSTFGDLMTGMLKGTMPDQEIQGYISFLMRAGQQFLQEFYQSSDAAADEAAGISFISFLVKKLGPTLGL